MTTVYSRVSRGKNITPSLTDKVRLFDLHKQKPKLGCRSLVELFKVTYTIEIGKSQIAKIIKNESNIQREYENFEGDMKRKKIVKYGIINDVFYEWYIKCSQTGIYPGGAMLQEESLKIKSELNDSNLGDIKASNRFLEHFKKRFVLRQARSEKPGMYLQLPSSLGRSNFQKLFKAILLMTSGIWMNQGSFLDYFQILG